MYKGTLLSLQNPLVKHCVKLRESRHYRKECGTVLITSSKLIFELSILYPPKRLFFLGKEALPQVEETYEVSEGILKKISNLPSPEGIVAEFSMPSFSPLTPVSSLLVLDRVSDPGNLGTLIRTAYALGWGGVFLLPECVDPFHEKVIRSSRASLFRFPWRAGNWDELKELKEMNGLTPYVADMEGEPLNTISSFTNPLLLMSNESTGLSQEAALFGKKIAIPMPGKMESLNVSAAGAILMYTMIV